MLKMIKTCFCCKEMIIELCHVQNSFICDNSLYAGTVSQKLYLTASTINCLLSKCLGLSQTIFMTGTLYCTYSLLTSLLFAAIRYISFSLYSSFSLFNVALTHCVSIAKRAPILFLSTPQLSNFVISAPFVSI